MAQPQILIKILLIALFSFVFNLAWEVPHSLLYKTTTEMKQPEFVRRILKASAGDIIMLLLIFLGISALNATFNWSITQKNNLLFSMLLGAVIAILFEVYAHATHRFEYLPSMPLIPFTNVGISPLLQMIVTPPVTFWVAEKILQ